MMRAVLPQRRNSVTVPVEFPRATGREMAVTIGHYDDWSVGEVFINVDRKVGTDGDVAGRDLGVLISFALQHGATPEQLAHAVTRDADGKPEGLAGIVLEAVAQWQREARA